MTRFVNLESDESAERVIDERPRPRLVERESPFQLIDDIAQDASERPVPWIIHDMAYLQGRSSCQGPQRSARAPCWLTSCGPAWTTISGLGAT